MLVRALSMTSVIGVFNPNAAIFRNKSQTVSAVMYVWFVTRTNSWLIAFNAPSTLYRCRPDAPRTNRRTLHHSQPKNAATTKWAASTKNSVRSPACASAKRGSSS
jgi:hypothetical protein